jgi:ankyrin repeat protein
MGIPFSDQAFLNEVSRNNEGVLDLFVKAGANLDAKNEKGQTALMIATEKGYESMHKRLLQLNGNILNHVDKSGNTALMIAARQGHENIVKSLVEKGADVNFTVPSQEGAASALQAAVDVSDFKEEHMRIIQYLVQHGADVKGRNKSGRFPLLFAADYGRTEAAKVLIEHGADVNATDIKGNFSLLTAACKGYPWFITLLAEKGADMKMALPDGYSPLMCAVKENHLDTINVLLEKHVNVNAKNANGLTALTDATRMGNVAIVKLFLERGADPASGYIPDSFIAFKGRSLAVKAKKKQLRDLLKPIAKTASQDGYKINADSKTAQVITLQAKGSWNKVLYEMARKNHLLLVVKEKEIYVFPYDPATIKGAALR